MSLKKRIVIAYAKSLLKSIQKNNNGENLDIGNIILKEKEKRFPDIFFIGEELLLIKTLIISSKVISEFFQNPTISEQKKLQIIIDVFPGLSLSITAFLKLLAERSHLSFLPEIANQYTNLLLSLRNSTTVKVITGSSLKENYALSFLNLLRKITKSKEIILKVFYSPRLLGGFILQYNSKSIDLSILKEFSLFFNEM
jgi:F-type H+-transporting ATPase subunit delta